MTERNKFLQSRKANASLKNFLNECFDCETWFNGFSKKELAKIVVKAIIAGAFLFSVLVVFVAAFG